MDVAPDGRDDRKIARREEDGPAPLSFAQELLWLMDRASPGTSVWNVPRAFRIRGAFDVAAFERALRALCARHESLRTVFVATPDGARQIVRAAGPVPLREVDLGAFRDDELARRAADAVRKEAERPFDLARDALLRTVLLTLGPADRILCLTSHHIVSDGWSKSVLFAELGALYAEEISGAPARLAPLPIQFADYAAWERAPAREPALAESLAYWQRQLARLTPLALPVDRPRPAEPAYAGARAVRTLPPALREGVAGLAREQRGTPYMVLLAAYATVLHRYAGQDDVAVGSPIASRTCPETERLIGYLADTLVLRCRLDGDPAFGEHLDRVRETCLFAFEHQEIPFERLALGLQQAGDLSPEPLFRALLTMEDPLPATLRLGAASVEPLDVEQGRIKADLTLLVSTVPDGLRLALWYRTDIFEASTAENLLRSLELVLSAAVRDPAQRLSALPLLSAGDRAALTAGVNATAVAFDGALVPERIAAAARRAPAVPAVVCGSVRLSYGELEARANRLALRLRERGAAPGSVVGVCVERSAEFFVALLAVWRAGAAYVALPPELPAARLRAQLAACEGRLVVVSPAGAGVAFGADVCTVALGEAGAEADAGAKAETGAEAEVGAELEAAAAAYVLFTSGSTGEPKGVVVTHGNLANYTRALELRLGVGEERLRYATVSSPAADLGHTAIFPALCTGSTLQVVPAEVAQDAGRFGELLAASPADVLKITPSHLRALLEGPAGGAVLPRRWLVLGGEACSWELVRRVQALGTCSIVNHYGPTETTVGACAYVVGEGEPEMAAACEATPSGTVPIGRPLANVRCYVLDGRGEPVPWGVAGELYVGGAGVAAGYAKRPDLTAERFEADPFAGEAEGRRYRTGDRVRRLHSGELEFLGRLDDQVKIRGYRVEPGELESALRAYPGIAEAAVVVRERGDGERELAAYAAGPGAGDPALGAWLAGRLPDYLLPQRVSVLERLPLTPSGKLDRAALPPAPAAPAAAYVAPRTATEAALASIWAEVLQLERISVEADVLALGFHSILAIRALGKLSRTLGVRLPLRALFDAPTLAALAELVDAERLAAEDRALAGALKALDDLPGAGSLPAGSR